MSIYRGLCFSVRRARSTVAGIVACGLVLVGAVACRQDAAVGPEAGGGTVRASQSPSAVGQISATVVHPDGSPLEGEETYAVGVVRASDGSVEAHLVTSSAPTVFTGLDVPGEYCVNAVPVGSAELLSNGTGPFVFPPSQEQALTRVATRYAAVLSGPHGTSVRLDRANFIANCTSNHEPAITLHNDNPVDVTLTLRDGTPFTAYIEGLDGLQASSDFGNRQNGYLGIPLTPADLDQFPAAWLPDAAQVRGGHANPAIIVAANPSAPNVPLVVDATLTDPLQFESDFLPIGSGVHLTGSASFGVDDLRPGTSGGTAASVLPTGGDVLQLAVSTEALMCSTKAVTEPGDDGTPGKVELLGPVRHGYQADTQLHPIPDAIAVWWHQTGTGDVTFTLRDRTLDGGTLKLQVTLTCSGSGIEGITCRESSANGTLLGTTDHLAVGGYDLPKGTTRVTVTVEDLPAGTLEWSVSTSGDQIPNASRFDQSSAFVPMDPAPDPSTTCTLTTNDPSWWDIN